MWTIRPLHVGSVTTIMGSVMMKHGARSNPGELTSLVHIAWLLEDAERGRTFLVDTGSDGNVERNSRLNNPVDRSEGRHVVEMLGRHGVSPEQIDGIILTHLHWDHAQAVTDLPATIPVYCQKEELKFAIDPFPTDAKHYETRATDRLPYFLRIFHQYRLLEGEEEIEPGIRVVPLPGHSCGSQGVVVDTAQGAFVLTGDQLNVLENWETRTPGGIYNDIGAYFASFRKLEQLERQGATILPGHDRRVLTRWPKIGAKD